MSDLLNGTEDADKNAIASDTTEDSVGSDVASSAPEEKPATPDKPKASNEALVEDLTKKAHDLDAARKSVEDAAAVSAGIWLSYLFTLFYIGIAAGGVTHKDLLLEKPVELPFLNVHLPIVAFFALAPILFVISHAYTLMHFVLLAAKVGNFNVELEKEAPDPDAVPKDELSPDRAKELHEIRLGLQRKLPSNIFVQFLGGPRDVRAGGLGLLLRAVAWISLVLGPALLLLLLQVQFLPYHLEWVIWVQRLALLADVILLWLLWPAVLESRSDIRVPRLWGSPALVFLAFLSLIPIGLAFFVARFPGEWIDQHISDKQWIPANLVTALLGATDYSGTPQKTSFHGLLFNGEVDQVTRRRKSLFSNTLVLPSFDALEAAKIDDQKKLESGNLKQSLVLRGRHLEGAVLTLADLRKADLEGALLQGATLWGAQLQGASLAKAKLKGANLIEAKLQGAFLEEAELQGAYADGAQLEGASLFVARLQAASLERARLEGASLVGANLQGASLMSAQLQGANLSSADLQGANLSDANLVGADLGEANLGMADISLVNIWRANFSLSKIILTDDAKQSKVLLLTNLLGKVRKIPASTKGFKALRDQITQNVPVFEAGNELGRMVNEINNGETNPRERALKQIEILNPHIFRSEVNNLGLFEKARVEQKDYEKALADMLKSLVCSANQDAPFILRGLSKAGPPFDPRLLQFNRNARILAIGTQAPKFVEAIVNPKAPNDCPVSATLTEDEKMELRKISADQMRDLVCQSDGNTLDILHGFLKDGYIKSVGDQAPDLVQAILDKDCPVSAILSDADKAALQKIKEAPAY